MRHLQQLVVSVLGLGALALMMVATGCGDDPPETIEGASDCEAACQHIQGDRSDGHCGQSFNFEDGSAMNMDECVESCEEDDLMLDGQECIASMDECLDAPDEYVDACLPEAYHPPACDHLDAWDPEVIQMEEEVLELVNQRRQEGADCGSEGSFPPADPIEMEEHLRCAARLHSIDMDERDFFAHDNPDGDGPGDRIAETGYMDGPTDRPTGENIAQGSQTAQQVMQGWMDSDGHCANIMRSSWDEIGVGMYENYWTQKFGN